MLLPSQYLDRILPEATIQPEKRLMLAVLESAVATYQRFALATSRRGRRLFGETEAWFSAADESWPFSFEVICSGLSLDSGFLRRGLRRWRERAVASATPGPARTPFRRKRQATQGHGPRGRHGVQAGVADTQPGQVDPFPAAR